MHSRHGFTVVELLVALLVASIGVGALIQLLSETVRAAHRDGRRAQAYALGQGLIAEFSTYSDQRRDQLFSQAVSRENALVWPEQAVLFASQPGEAVSGGKPAPRYSWQWWWVREQRAEAEARLQLRISSDWDQPSETVNLAAAF